MVRRREVRESRTGRSPRQRQVEQHHIRFSCLDHADDLLRGTRLPDHLDAAFLFQQRQKARPHDGMVITKHNSRHSQHPITPTPKTRPNRKTPPHDPENERALAVMGFACRLRR